MDVLSREAPHGLTARRLIEPFVAARSLSERLDAFVALARWTRRDWEEAEGDGAEHAGQAPARARLDAALERLETSEELRRRYQAAAAALFAESDGTNVFAHAGIPSERGFLAELGERLMDHLLPRPRDDRDLASLLRRLFRTEADVTRFARIPDDAFARLARIHFPSEHPEAVASLRRSFADGFRLLAATVLAQGLSPKLRKRSRPCEVSASPFFLAARASDAVVDRWLAGTVPAAEARAWRGASARCREELAEVHRRVERDGVSTHVVYGLEVVERCLARMDAMADVMAAESAAALLPTLHRLLADLASSVHRDRSALHLLSWNTRLLQRKIVERSGRTGEHYIANNREEYRAMWLAAAGGGLLTVGTAAIKTAISSWHAPDFVHGFLYGLNYAVSFLLLQRFGLVLATKQPAMTAATLATIVRERRGRERGREIVTLAARICSSQLAAAVSNVVVVAAGAAGFVWIWQLALSRPFLSRDEAEAVYTALSPINSGTVFYAALTGVILWLASVVGGWFDNFCAYHRLPLTIAQHPLGDRLGRERMARWGEALSRNASGWATNVSLGFMLGMTPAIGHFLGVPLDVRHVTLNSGILSLAGSSLGHRWFGEGMFLSGVAGVAVMFVLNLSVSFLLALVTAARAYGFPASDVRLFLRLLVRRFLTSPLEFVLPMGNGTRRDGSGPDDAPSAGGGP